MLSLLTVAWAQQVHSAAALPQPHCASPRPPVARIPARPDGPAPAVLEDRDAYGASQVHLTDHFALRWGDDLDADTASIEALGADFERAWNAQVETLGWRQPPGSDAWRVNVYVADTGPGLPSIPFSGGFVDIDGEGFPYVAVSPDLVTDHGTPEGADNAAWVAAHEFNHTLQVHDDGFTAGRYGAWFHEASANWAVPFTLDRDGEPDWGVYLLNPQVALDMAAWDGPREEEGRQYDAAAFLYAVSDARGPGVMRDAWMDAHRDDDALVVLDALTDGGLRDLFVAFARTHALGDHRLAELYEEGIRYWGQGEPDHRITAVVEPTRGLEDPPADLLPDGWAWNHLQLDVTEAGVLVADLDAEPEGSLGSPSNLVAKLVVERAGGVLEDHGLGEDVAVEPGDRVHLLVISVPQTARAGERFGYRYALELDGDGRGCTVGRGPGWPGLGALLGRR